jgi:hypothetical protein
MVPLIIHNLVRSLGISLTVSLLDGSGEFASPVLNAQCLPRMTSQTAFCKCLVGVNKFCRFVTIVYYLNYKFLDIIHRLSLIKMLIKTIKIIDTFN